MGLKADGGQGQGWMVGWGSGPVWVLGPQLSGRMLDVLLHSFLEQKAAGAGCAR